MHKVKLSKIAKNFDSMASGAFWVVAVLGVIVVLAGIVGLFLPGTLFTNMTTNLIVGDISFEIADGYLPEAADVKLFLAFGIASLAVIFAVACIALRIFRNILAPMKQMMPFDGTVSVNLNRLSILALAGGGAAAVIDVIRRIVTYDIFDVYNLFVGERIADIMVEIKLDLGFLWVFALLKVLSVIFSYAEELQKESDETL